MKSKFLNDNRTKAKEIISKLNEVFDYASVLGTDVSDTVLRVFKSSTDSNESYSNEKGFVFKMSNGESFYEYAIDNLDEDVDTIFNKIMESTLISINLKQKEIKSSKVEDELLVMSFDRPNDLEFYPITKRLEILTDIKNQLLSKSDKILNGGVVLTILDVNKLFISNNKELDQHYTWCNGVLIIMYSDNEKLVSAREVSFSHLLKDVFEEMPTKFEKLVDKAAHLTKATQIKPGVYDIITDASISGLIAHEAFGHGVEMDQFVKDRALAKKYVGEYVASPITNMRDGAGSCLSVASYFFDDDGVLAHDTQIIKNGILVQGLCDLTSSRQLNVEPTGNGRRENYDHKAYTRMTNTFFEKGSDKLEDMIKSIKHGYFLFETNNGMEDPKNWAIQCTAEYGIEIVDGKLTENYVSPIVMSGYVPDLLKSITMISDEFEVEGAGSCGKGYKEWVRVSTGGPHLKARVKLS